MNAIRTLALAALVVVGSLVAAEQASAQTHYISGVIRNNCKFTVNFQYRHKSVQNNAWITVSLKPGNQAIFSHVYPATNDPIEVRFDHTLKDNTTVFKYTTVARHVCKRPIDGWLQVFVPVNDMRNLHLAR